MPYVDEDDDFDDDQIGERELPDPSDFDDRDTTPCPHCGKEIYDDVEQCPECGESIEQGLNARKPWWIILGLILLAIALVYWAYVYSRALAPTSGSPR